MSESDEAPFWTSSAAHTAADGTQGRGAPATRWQRFIDFLDQRSIKIPIYAGAAAFFILPVGVLIVKAASCGIASDYSGVPLCLTPFLIVAAGASALASALGLVIGHLLEKRAVRRSALIGTVIGSLLAMAAAAAISVYPAGMLLFPDC